MPNVGKSTLFNVMTKCSIPGELFSHDLRRGTDMPDGGLALRGAACAELRGLLRISEKCGVRMRRARVSRRVPLPAPVRVFRAV